MDVISIIILFVPQWIRLLYFYTSLDNLQKSLENLAPTIVYITFYSLLEADNNRESKPKCWTWSRGSVTIISLFYWVPWTTGEYKKRTRPNKCLIDVITMVMDRTIFSHNHGQISRDVTLSSQLICEWVSTNQSSHNLMSCPFLLCPCQYLYPLYRCLCF